MKKVLFLPLFLALSLFCFGQQNDSLFIAKIFQSAIMSQNATKTLQFLCDSAPGRLLGSKHSIVAVKYLKNEIDALNPDTCFLQEYHTSAWEHVKTNASILANEKEIKLHTLALGPSVSTGNKVLEAEVIEVKDFKDLDSLGKERIAGKIVFFNHVMNNSFVSPSNAYREAIHIRIFGAIQAAKYGAKAAVMRSLTTIIDTFPHTGKTVYADTVNKIPFVALSTYDAELLSSKLKTNSSLKLKLSVETKAIDDTKTYNIVADIKGSQFPDKYILIGAHIDSWYNCQGAHDDGAGCSQIIDIMRIMKELGYKNKYTFRFVLFMDEELSQTGCKVYANYTETNKIDHIAAIETDAGGFAPRTFAIDASDAALQQFRSFIPLLQPYGIFSMYAGDTDVDIDPLKKFNVPLIGVKPNMQRYFDFHHSGFDTFDKVNFRELQLSTTTLAAMMYLIDNYRIKL